MVCPLIFRETTLVDLITLQLNMYFYFSQGVGGRGEREDGIMLRPEKYEYRENGHTN